MSDKSRTHVFTGIRPMTEQDLGLVLEWRNHPEIRRCMYNRQLIAMEEHLNWFERTSRRSRDHLLIYEAECVPAGFAKLCQTDCGLIAEWGFYAAPDAPKGTGRRLGAAVLNYAFLDIGLHKVYGQVLGLNGRSIRFHRQLGFQEEGVLRDQYFDGVSYHPVHCFGMLASEWNAGEKGS